MFVVPVLLPLQHHWVNNNIGRVQHCRGLILIPAGPDIVRRIGVFSWLDEHELGDLAEQEITIV